MHKTTYTTCHSRWPTNALHPQHQQVDGILSLKGNGNHEPCHGSSTCNSSILCNVSLGKIAVQHIPHLWPASQTTMGLWRSSCSSFVWLPAILAPTIEGYLWGGLKSRSSFFIQDWGIPLCRLISSPEELGQSLGYTLSSCLIHIHISLYLYMLYELWRGDLNEPTERCVYVAGWWREEP